ncbi:Gti1/Pac2 family transcription factor [Nematocida minor]|uniref:Gti1/Pac2 family transcription factor n=1 Tax=Nematocida minor TaxID=1912983 RepID=UPI00221FF9E0|nr:Gti1/Pac2 family transcription factor [Nematocida minor]XP_051332102.1 Gti1/Pac2 family transcription factor [Nematocida minor]KAI5188832.1 Gti1/Pac2 family transcription factor [Nematocida minor]KAI5188936.1 Gti1/Pac2 family transcription factor [Nematocida minor]
MDRIMEGKTLAFSSRGSAMCAETIFGVINSEEECLKVIDMARLSALPRVKSRLSDEERNSIRPGSIYVYEEEESGISRWTDSKTWSSSKIQGRCLMYYELAETPCDERLESLRYSSSLENVLSTGREIISLGVHEKKVRKKNGLIKMTTSLVYESKSYHLLSYFTEPFSKEYTRGPIWNMVYAWEIPFNLVLRVNYRRRRKTGKIPTNDSIKPIKIRQRYEKKLNSFPLSEKQGVVRKETEDIDITREILDEYALPSNNGFFSFQ